MIRTVAGRTWAMISLVDGAAGAGSGSDEKTPLTAAATAPAATSTAMTASSVARRTDRSRRRRWMTLESPETIRRIRERSSLAGAAAAGSVAVPAPGSTRMPLAPIRSESPGASVTGRSIRRPLTNVPLLEPRSPTSTPPSTSCR